jgi:hypothetical protein
MEEFEESYEEGGPVKITLEYVARDLAETMGDAIWADETTDGHPNSELVRKLNEIAALGRDNDEEVLVKPAASRASDK